MCDIFALVVSKGLRLIYDICVDYMNLPSGKMTEYDLGYLVYFYFVGSWGANLDVVLVLHCVINDVGVIGAGWVTTIVINFISVLI